MDWPTGASDGGAELHMKEEQILTLWSAEKKVWRPRWFVLENVAKQFANAELSRLLSCRVL